MAPEVFDNYQHCSADNFGYTIKYDPYKADIYSIGVTLLMMAGMPKQLRFQSIILLFAGFKELTAKRRRLKRNYC